METTLAHSLPTDERTLVRRAQAGDIEAFGALVITAHFTTGETGLHTTIDIPQQGATGVQLKNVSYDDSRVYMELPAGAGLAVFDGRQVDDSIGGAFTQAGLSGTFFLKRSSQAAAIAEEPPEPLLERVSR